MFVTAPAATIKTLFQAGFKLNDPISFEDSSSPSILTKPPMGIALREYSVSPLCHEYNLGPIKIENS